MLQAIERFVDSQLNAEDKAETRRQAMEVATNLNKTAHAVKNCGPLVAFFRKWNLQIDHESLAFHLEHILGDATPNTENAALSWAVFIRRVFSENKLPYDRRPEMVFDRSISLCLRQPHRTNPGPLRPRNPHADQFAAFARELFTTIFPGDELGEVDTLVDELDHSGYDWAIATCTPRALTFRLSFTTQQGMYIGILADHTNEGRSVTALAEFFTRRFLILKSVDLVTLYEQILRQPPPHIGTPPADAWAEFLKRVLDANRLPYPRRSNVFERSVQLCLDNTVTSHAGFAAGLANLLFPREAPCTMYANTSNDPNQIMIPFTKRDDGLRFGFLFTVNPPGLEFGILLTNAL